MEITKTSETAADYRRKFDSEISISPTPWDQRPIIERFFPDGTDKVLLVGAASIKSVNGMTYVLDSLDTDERLSSSGAELTVFDIRLDPVKAIAKGLKSRVFSTDRVKVNPPFVGDAATMPLPKDEYGFVYSDYLLNWVPKEKQPAVIREMYDKAAREGVIVAVYKTDPKHDSNLNHLENMSTRGVHGCELEQICKDLGIPDHNVSIHKVSEIRKKMSKGFIDSILDRLFVQNPEDEVLVIKKSSPLQNTGGR